MIRINLLAEEQAAEEQRRRDPVKRAILGGGLAVVAMVLWISLMQLKVMSSNSVLQQTEGKWRDLEKKDSLVRTNRYKTIEIGQRLAALEKLSTNRFLWSAPLNALQFCVLDQVQLTEFTAVQKFLPEKAKYDPSGKLTAPPAVIERVSITLRVNDFAPATEPSHPKFMDAIKSHAYFRDHLRQPDPVKFVERLTAGAGEGSETKKTATFTIECQFLDRVR